ncbi:MAG: hypothetical protein J6T74_05415, partial [Clostridia bacterium]|nr:hypothetical protein [Clostridia bacterium]
MISEEQIELLVERLIDRVEKANSLYLQHLGKSIKQTRNLTPSEAHKLAQTLKYGGKYEEIIKEMSKYTNLDVEELDKIFYNYAKKDQLFYEKFYKYKDIPFIPFD